MVKQKKIDGIRKHKKEGLLIKKTQKEKVLVLYYIEIRLVLEIVLVDEKHEDQLDKYNIPLRSGICLQLSGQLPTIFL